MPELHCEVDVHVHVRLNMYTVMVSPVQEHEKW